MSNKTLLLLMGFVAFLILVVGVIGVVAIAGGGGDDTNASTGGIPKATAKPKSSSGSGGGGICQGKSLIVPGNDPTSQLDPIQVADVDTSVYIYEIFSGLVTLDKDLKVQPDLAKSWEVSADGKMYTFTLRDNILFHDNRRVTAKDVKDSIERAADPKNASPTVKAYLGDIVGINDKFDGKAKEVSGVTVVDDKTVRIQLIEPADFFLAELTYPVSFVVDVQQIAKDPLNWTRKPNGTGPFKLAEFSPTQRIRLVKNDNFYLGAPKLDEVVFELGGGSISTRYENNELHIGFVPPQELASVKDGSSPLAKDYKPGNELAVFYITLNTKQPPFDDPKVRQALAMSIDKENINEVLLYGTQRVATSFAPPDMPGYDKSVRGYGYDPARAKQLLSESKYAGKMPRIVMNYGGSGGSSPDILVAIQKGWQDTLGVTVELQAVDPAAYLREQRRGTFQMLSDGWSADYPDLEDFTGKLFRSDSTLNLTKYVNAAVDALLQQARRETDRTKRNGLYAQAEQKILDDAPVIPLFWPVTHTLVKPCVKDYPIASMTIERYRTVDIDPKGN
ncbi:MAG: peptide ABC transporter substrate-binding protein [Chloroflexi bacterium]|nr:peptide ABC transporter substrate-binding protein [Chloroflexota bacterium]